MRTTWTILLAATCGVSSPVLGTGVLEASSSACRIAFPGPGEPGHLPAPQHFDQSTLLMWVTPSVSNSGVRSVLSEANGFAVELDVSNATWHVRLEGTTDLEVLLPLGKPTELLGGTTLIGCTWDASARRLEAWARSDSAGAAAGVVTNQGFEVTKSTAGLVLGSSDEDLPAMLGTYGLVVLRTDALSEADFSEIYQSGHYFAPMRMEMPGSAVDEESVRWMLNHAVATDPDWDRIGLADVEPALLGSRVVPGSICVFDLLDENNSLVMAGWIDAVSTGMHAFTWTSPFLEEGEGFFVHEQPVLDENDNGVPPPWIHAHPDAIINAAIRGESTGLVRMVVGGNSRSVRNADAGNQTRPENFAHGFIDVLAPSVAGFCNANADDSPGIRGFGFDRLAAPRVSGDLVKIHSWLEEPQRTFSRFWTGSPYWSSKGPGSGVFLGDGAQYALLCRPEAGTLMDGSLEDGTSADFEMTARAYLMRFPGAGSVQIRTEASNGQGFSGELGPPVFFDLAPERQLVLVLDGDSTVEPSKNEITVPGDYAGDFVANDVCFIADGDGAGGIVMLDGAIFDGTHTTFHTRHWFTDSPSEGSQLHIGPWSVEVVERILPARDVADDRIWRGLELTALNGPVACFAHDAWRSDIDSGLVIGLAGWAGHGYADQRSHSSPDAIGKMSAALSADIWLMTLANNQGGSTAQHGDYCTSLRTTSADMSIAWLSSGEHAEESDAHWHRYILNNAESFQVPSVSLLFDPAVGCFEDQCAGGWRADTSHMSDLGNQRLATLWVEKLLEATAGSSDLNGDGRVDVLDLLEIIAAWGWCGSCPQDLTGDGVVDVLDLLAVLADWT